jgi:hypothetical protein
MLETLSPTVSPGRDLSQTTQAMQATNANAIMISDDLMDGFMPPKITADRSGGQAID